MRMNRYQTADDLRRVQAALMRWVAIDGHSNLLHTGDIGHRLFNGAYGYDSGDILRYWTDAAGQIQAFALLYPHWSGFDLQVSPQAKKSAWHGELIATCERETLRLADKYDKTIEAIGTEADDSDPDFAAFLQARGYQQAKHAITLTRHDLSYIPDAPLPAGFHFHQAALADADQLAAVHNASFTAKWNAESYAQVFSAPHMERELVVVAPDGSFAAFVNLWQDKLNRSMLFEPVGAHEDYRRRGLAKALMCHALRRMMAEWGIERAYVCHAPEASNPAAAALYAAVGFTKLYEAHEYSKPASDIRWA